MNQILKKKKNKRDGEEQEVMVLMEIKLRNIIQRKEQLLDLLKNLKMQQVINGLITLDSKLYQENIQLLFWMMEMIQLQMMVIIFLLITL